MQQIKTLVSGTEIVEFAVFDRSEEYVKSTKFY